MEPRGKRRDYEDLRPTRFVPGPAREGEYPEYPWVAKGPQPKDFLGNEFFLWLWHEADAGSEHGSHRMPEKSPSSSTGRSISIAPTARPAAIPFAAPARRECPKQGTHLRSGKLPRKAGLVLDASGMQFTLSLAAESLAVGAAKLPEVEEAETPRVLFEERIALLRDLSKTIDGMFDAFLKIRASSAWEGQVSTIRRWIQSSKNVAAA